MANNQTEGASEDFLQQFLGFPGTNLAGIGGGATPMMLQLSSGDGSVHLGNGGGAGVGLSGFGNPFHGTGVSSFPLGRGGFMKMEKRFGDDSRASSVRPGFHGQPKPSSVPAASHLPMIRPRVRARRGQATDPHSIAERIRRERITERIRALQELVPSVNKTDRAVMLDEIVDYVKFLRLQVKVLSMSRLGGAGSVASSSLEEESSEAVRSEPWEKWSSDGTEQQVTKLMEENVGGAMQFLQSKALCIMPISLASAIYHCQPTENPSSSS